MKTVLIGERYRSALATPLAAHGYRVLFLPDNPKIDSRLAGHADLNVFFGRNKLYLSEHLTECAELVN